LKILVDNRQENWKEILPVTGKTGKIYYQFPFLRRPLAILRVISEKIEMQY